MSWSVTNQSQMRTKILIGSPKKNAACRSFSNMSGGITPGVVMAHQKTKITTSTSACQNRRVPVRGRMNFHMSGRQLLLRVALQDFLAHHVPDRLVQFDEARGYADLGHVTRPRQVDQELADRMGRRPGRQHH